MRERREGIRKGIRSRESLLMLINCDLFVRT